MSQENEIGFPFSSKVERYMKRFYNSLNEKDRRHYIALEAEKLRYSGQLIASFSLTN